MKTLSIITLFVLNLNAHAFTLNNSASAAFKLDKIPVEVSDIGCPNQGISAEEINELVGVAISQYWNKVPTSKLHLVQGGLVSVAQAFYDDPICNAGTNCEPNPALKVAKNILISCNESNTFNFAGTLGVSLPNNISGQEIKGSLVLINDRMISPFASKSRDEKIAIIAHEIGHAIGIGHSAVVDSLMYYQSVPTRRSLGSDDIDAVTYLYPKDQPFDVNCGALVPINHNNDGPGGNQLLLTLIALLALATFSLRNTKREL